MTITVVRVYDNFVAADQARSELLRCGFCETNVELTIKEDEAGSVHGNVALADNRNPKPGFFGNWFRRRDSGSLEHEDQPDEVVQRGIYLLIVDAGDDMQHDRAADIMHQFGAFDIEQRIANRPNA